ncbi:MAG: ABC transporter substrate-binding protein [Bdellovibrionales bacterium]|nr:ABC transporter substrate-binding protein [Bdellovibrionales bacterium]
MKQYLTFAVFFSVTANAATIPVKIHFFEALAPKDTTSSERFQKEYDGAISTAKILVGPRLKKCGYQLETSTVFYNASDALEAMERGKASANQNAWLIVGPRRSNHYVLLVKGAENTPTVSTMASSKEVFELGSTHNTMAPSNAQMARVAATEAKKRAAKNKTFVSLVSEDCVACVDFAESFAAEAQKLGIKNTKTFKVAGETPNLSDIVLDIKNLKPSFVLLPNYSKVTAQAIAAIHKSVPDAFYVGGDGWGDSRFGFVQNAADLDGTHGFTVRGFPTTEEGLKAFPLGKDLLKSKDASVQQPGSASALSLLKILDSTVSLLCESKPKNKDEFTKAISKKGRSAFKSPWGVSIYEMKSGDISFGRSVSK